MTTCPMCSRKALKEVTLEYTDKQVVVGKCIACGYTEQHEYRRGALKPTKSTYEGGAQ